MSVESQLERMERTLDRLVIEVRSLTWEVENLAEEIGLPAYFPTTAITVVVGAPDA
jgi:hypothetical protein